MDLSTDSCGIYFFALLKKLKVAKRIWEWYTVKNISSYSWEEDYKEYELDEELKTKESY